MHLLICDVMKKDYMINAKVQTYISQNHYKRSYYTTYYLER